MIRPGADQAEHEQWERDVAHGQADPDRSESDAAHDDWFLCADHWAEKAPVDHIALAYVEAPSPRERTYWFAELSHKWAEDAETGCWVWAEALNRSGYGVAHTRKDETRDGKRRTIQAHRYVYERLVGPIPKGLHLDHLCRNRPCVNPAHLEPVTPAVNNARSESVSAKNMVKTHCQNGHPFSGENLHVRKNGERECKQCKKDWRARNEPKKVWPTTCERCGDTLPEKKRRFCSRKCERWALHGGTCVDCGAETFGHAGRGAAERCKTCNHKHRAKLNSEHWAEVRQEREARNALRPRTGNVTPIPSSTRCPCGARETGWPHPGHRFTCPRYAKNPTRDAA